MMNESILYKYTSKQENIRTKKMQHHNSHIMYRWEQKKHHNVGAEKLELVVKRTEKERHVCFTTGCTTNIRVHPSPSTCHLIQGSHTQFNHSCLSTTITLIYSLGLV